MRQLAGAATGLLGSLPQSGGGAGIQGWIVTMGLGAWRLEPILASLFRLFQGGIIRGGIDFVGSLTKSCPCACNTNFGNYRTHLQMRDLYLHTSSGVGFQFLRDVKEIRRVWELAGQRWLAFKCGVVKCTSKFQLVLSDKTLR